MNFAESAYTRNLPALTELQARPQWVCWRRQERKGKWTKVPYNPCTGAFAHSDSPQTWATYAQAMQALRAGSYDGIGYVFHRDYTGIDLDHCVNADGSIDSWAKAYLARLPSYAEYSPSQTGIHILLRGTIPGGTRQHVPDTPHPEAAIEMYCERRYFTVTGWHLRGTPTSIEDCAELQVVYRELRMMKQHQQDVVQQHVGGSSNLSDDALLEKAMSARNGQTFRVLWQGDTSGYPSQSEAELALCDLLAFWTGNDAHRIDRLFRRSGLYREKWDQPARTGELYGQGTIARAIAACVQAYNPQPKGKIIQFRRPPQHASEEEGISLPETQLDFVLDCLRDEEEGDARLYAHLFRGKCVYDHTEGMGYEWQGHHWERDECKHSLLLASGPLASVYLDTSAQLAEEAAQAEKRLDPDLLTERKDDPRLKHYEWLKARTAELIGRAKALKKLKRAQAVLTYAQAFLNITSRQWGTDSWLLGTRQGVLDLRTGTLRPGKPEEYIRTIIPTIWRGLEEPAPRFEQYLHEIFADRQETEREELITFLQRALGYGITGHVHEHIFLVLYGEEGRNGKDTLMSCLQRVLGDLVGAVSNDVIIAGGKFLTPGSAKPHLCALQGKRIAWASETSKGARFDVGQVKFLTGGGDIPARQLYGRDYTFAPTHLLILLTNHKPHADAQDAAFWDRLCPIIFTMRFVDHPIAPNERQRDKTLHDALDAESSGILAWLVRGCLDWQREGLNIPASVLMARREYREEEDTLGHFLATCCILHEHASVKAGRLYERYKRWATENSLKAMNGNAFGLEMKKLFEQKRRNEGCVYFGIGLLEDGVPDTLFQDEGLHSSETASEESSVPSQEVSNAGSVPSSHNYPYIKDKKVQTESSKEQGTGSTQGTSPTVDETSSEAASEKNQDAEECLHPREIEVFYL